MSDQQPSLLSKQAFQTSKNIQSLVVVGGGSAGWMTAAMLAKQLGSSVKITLVESEEIGTIGVGEATIPPIQNFNRLLGINESDFVSFCNGSIKLAIEFENWTTQNHKYMHPFGTFGIDFDYMPFPYYWLKAKAAAETRPLQEFSMAWHLANNNKFMKPGDNTSAHSPLASTFDYAYHFDAGRYALFLRNFAENMGVTRIEGKVESVVNCEQSGNIKELLLEGSEPQIIKADFFVDCTGQRAVLLGQNLKVEFEDWSEYLLNDRAIAIQTAHMTQLKPYTRSIAHHAGWQWRIPLQTRMGNGNVYSSKFMNDDEALEILLSTVEGPTLTEPNFIKFKTGRRQQFWQKNCVAIGLSAGFLEPLESTSLHLIQSAIMRLVRLFPDASMSQNLQDEYNKLTVEEYEDIRDFIILHYKATERTDSDYWRYCQSMPIPNGLEARLALYKEHGHLTIADKALFKHENWLAVLTGQNVLPQHVAPVVAGKDEFDLKRMLDAMHKNMQEIAAGSMSHEMYLMKHWPHKPD